MPEIKKEEIVKKKVAVYIRVSSDDQVELYWPDNQKEKILNYIKARGEQRELPIEDDIYFDAWVSGTLEIDKRPALKQLFDKIEYSAETQKPYDMILVYKIDRFARRLSVLLEIVERLRLYNVWFASVTESIDTDTPFGNAMLGILWVFAELERSLIQERTSGGREQAVKQGKWMNDKYWYERVNNDPFILEEEAKVVRMIYDFFVNQRLSVAEIVRKLADLKIPLPTATKTKKRKKEGMDRVVHDIYKRWDKTIRNILSDKVYIGEYYYWKTKTIKDPKKGNITVPVPEEERQKSTFKYASIIDENLFYQAQEMLDTKVWGTGRKENSDYLLSWLLRCCACQPLRRDNKPLNIKGLPWWKHKYYQCNGKNSQKFEGRRCRVVPLPKEELENFVVEHIKHFFWEAKHFELFVNQHKSNGVNTKYLNEQKDLLLSKYNKIELALRNIQQQYDDWEINKEDRDKKNHLKISERSEIEAKILVINKNLKEQADVEKYKAWMGLIKNMIGKNIDKLFDDRKLLQRFLNYLISDIFVYSRDATEKDKITGKKKANGEIQQIPYAIDIQMRLPQEILQSLFEEAKSLEQISEELIAPSEKELDKEIDDMIKKNDERFEKEENAQHHYKGE